MKLRPSKSLEIIKKIVEEKFQTRLDRNTRIPYVVYARYIYYRICKDFTSSSLTQIGGLVNRDHATVLHGLKKFDDLVFTNDREYLDLYHEIRDSLLNKLNVLVGEEKYYTIDELIEQNHILHGENKKLQEKCKVLKEFIGNGLLKEYKDFFELAKKRYGYDPHHAKEKYKILNRTLEKIS